jgi:hypothetical protein
MPDTGFSERFARYHVDTQQRRQQACYNKHGVDSYRRYYEFWFAPSAQIKKMGRNPAIVKTVIMLPDWLLSVMRHPMAYCTTIVPKSDNACPVKNNAVFFLVH